MQNDSCPVIQAELLAQELESKGKFSEAMRVWLGFVEKTGDSAVAWTESVRLALRANDPNLANTLGLLGLQNAGKHFSVWEAWANIPAHYKNWAEAAERWDVVLKKFPDESHGWLGAAWIYIQNEKPAEAEDHIMVSLRKGKPTSRAYRMLIDIHAKNKEMGDSLITTALRLFPEEGDLYHHIFESLVRVGRLDKAEAILLEGAAQFPHDADLVADRAELAFLRKDYKTALARFQEMQKAFPESQKPISGMIKAALKLGDLNILLQAWKLTQTLTCISLELDAAYATKIREFLKEDARLHDNRHFTEYMELLKACNSASPYEYEAMSDFYIRRNKYEKAHSICCEAFANNVHSDKLCLNLARIRALAGDYRGASLIYNSLALAQEGRTPTALAAARGFFHYGMYEEARRVIQDLISRYGANLELIDLYFRTELALNPESMGKVLKKFIPLYNALPEALTITSVAFKRMMNLMWANERVNSSYTKAHALLLDRTVSSLKKDSKKIQSKKLACFCLNTDTIHFYAPVIKYFTPDSLDLVLVGKEKVGAQRLEQCGLSNYNAAFNPAAVNDYKYCICDTWYIHLKMFSPPNIICGVAHEGAQYFSTSWFKNVNSMIYSCSNYASWDFIRLNKNEYKSIARGPVNAKCEFSFSGLFHMDGWFGRDKKELRKELSETYEFEVPDDRPLVFFLEDEVCDWNQIVRCANKLSESCTVFLKPMIVHLGAQAQRKLSSKIYCFKDWKLNNNLLRFSADIILASYFSGTLLSSIMAGLPILPYYSKYVSKAKFGLKGLGRPSYFLGNMPESVQSNIVFPHFPHQVLMSLLRKYNMFFDLAHPEYMQEAIFSGQYLRKYHEILPTLQREAFGEFELEGAAAKMHRLLQNFIDNNTFGKDCVAVYFK